MAKSEVFIALEPYLKFSFDVKAAPYPYLKLWEWLPAAIITEIKKRPDL
jgi:hypothetical protein